MDEEFTSSKNKRRMKMKCSVHKNVVIKPVKGIESDFMHCRNVITCSDCGMLIRAANVTDGFHGFQELYEHRQALFCALVNSNIDVSWKSRLHEDGTMFDGPENWFIAGIKTVDGMATYHLEGRFWDKMKCAEIDNAFKWDGHTPDDVIRRLLKI